MARQNLAYDQIKAAFLGGDNACAQYMKEHNLDSGFFEVALTFAVRMAREEEPDLQRGSGLIVLAANKLRVDAEKKLNLQKTFFRVLRELPINVHASGFHLAYAATKEAEYENGILSLEDCEMALHNECSKLSNLCIEEAKKMNEFVEKAETIEIAMEQIKRRQEESSFRFGVVFFNGQLVANYASANPSLSGKMSILAESYNSTSNALHDLERTDLAILMDAIVAAQLPRILKIAQMATANLTRRVEREIEKHCDDHPEQLVSLSSFIENLMKDATPINPDFLKACDEAQQKLKPFLPPTRSPASAARETSQLAPA